MGKKSFILRIDLELFEELRAWADDELRSVNGQVEYVLRDAIRKRRGGSLKYEVEQADNKKPAPPTS